MSTETTNPSAAAAPDEEIDAFAEKVFDDLLGAMSTYATAIGVALGWYDALGTADSLTSVELAAATSTDERYAREWLEQQAVSGYVAVDNAELAPDNRRFRMSAAAAEVLTNRDNLSYMAPFPGFIAGLGRSLDRIIDVYRTGEGYGWHEHGDGARCGQAEANRPMFLHALGPDYLSSIPEVDAALRNGGTVADLGCGLGWSSVGIAKTYPNSTVHGYDIDGPSIEMARANADAAGLSDRVSFRAADVGSVDAQGYDLVIALECVHDLADPVSFLASMKRMVAPDGTVIVMDERVGETFTGEPDAVEQFMYGFSLICCLPDGRNAASSTATGTVMRPPTLAAYAADAGFADIETLPIENDFFRFYRLAH